MEKSFRFLKGAIKFMFRFTSILLLAIQLSPTTTIDTDFAKLYDKCARLIRQVYWAKNERKAEMEQILESSKSAASSANNREDFTKAMISMIAKFKDSHFNFLPDDRQGYYTFEGLTKGKDASEMPSIGAWFKTTPDGYTVQMVMEGGSAAEAGLRKGDMILSVDGQPFSPISSLRSKVDKSVVLRYSRGGTVKESKASVKSEPALKMFLDATRVSAKVIESGGKKIGYVHLWTMANTDFRDALSNIVYGKLKDTDAMILDIRDGFGGRPEGYGDPFFRPEVTIEWTMSGAARPTRQLFGYQRPLVLLTNRGSRSAKEVFSAILKKSGRAILVGEPTSGDVLGTSPIRVSDWAYLEIPMVDVKVDGKRIERIGVTPDVAVPREFDEQGKDLYIEEALKVLAEKLKKQR